MVPRYGEGVVGGAETLARLLAEQLAARGRAVDVLTTCATDHFTWANVLPEGQAWENGVRVRRFRVDDRSADRHMHLHGAIARGMPATYGEQVEWMATSVSSGSMLAAADEYDWLIALPYLFGTTFWTTVAYPERTVLMPCLHDERHAHQRVIADVLRSARGVMANSPGEKRLVDRLLKADQGRPAGGHRTATTIVGAGFDPVPTPTEAGTVAVRARFDLPSDYLLYAGRREEAKGVDHLFANYRAFRRGAPGSTPPLALMGTGDLSTPPDLRPHVIDLGFVDTEDRAAVYAGASVLIQPSRLESFGMVLFEAWLAGTPVLVNAESEVLREHIRDSAGGMAYGSAGDFCNSLEVLLDDPELRVAMAAAGRAYTLEAFSWDAVIGRFDRALEEWR